jgi:lysophospholipase L1-like esterase
MRRAGGVLEALGFTVERSAVEIFEGHPDNVSMLRAGLREFAALTYYWMRGWTSGSDPPSGPVRHSTMSGTPPAIAPLSGPVVVLGASYAQGWHLTSVAGAPVVNRGTSGQQSFELLERFERDVVQEKPRAVLIWGFINDIFRSPDGAMDATAARIRDSYTEMVRVARQHGITPVVATEVTARPRSGVTDTVAGWVGAVRGKEAYQDVINRHVLAMNRWLVEFATRERLLVLDFQAVLSEPGGRRRKVFAQPDGSHITAAGYDMLTSYAQPILEEFLRDR